MKITSYLPLMLVPLIAAVGSQAFMPPPDECVPANHITILPKTAAVTAVPENICAYRGEPITVIVTDNRAGMPKKGSVSTTPEVAENTWLSGSNASNASIFELFVNDDVELGTYKYIVNTQDGDELDPRVTVLD